MSKKNQKKNTHYLVHLFNYQYFMNKVVQLMYK